VELTNPCRRITIKERKIVWKATGFGFQEASDRVDMETEDSVVEMTATPTRKTASPSHVILPIDREDVRMNETEESVVSLTEGEGELGPKERATAGEPSNAEPGPIDRSGSGQRLSRTPMGSNSRSSSALRDSAALAAMQETLQSLERKHADDIQKLVEAFTASSQAVQEELRLLRAEVRQRSEDRGTPKSDRTGRSSSVSDKHGKRRRHGTSMRSLEDVEEFDVEDMYATDMQ